jgi:hypothetical protein
MCAGFTLSFVKFASHKLISLREHLDLSNSNSIKLGNMEAELAWIKVAHIAGELKI